MLKKEQVTGMNQMYRFYSFEYFLQCMEEIGVESLELWMGAPHFWVDTIGYFQCLEKKKEILLSRECFCILITQNQYPGLVSELEFLGRRNHGSLYVATLAPDMELKIESGGQMQVYRWEVRP